MSLSTLLYSVHLQGGKAGVRDVSGGGVCSVGKVESVIRVEIVLTFGPKKVVVWFKTGAVVLIVVDESIMETDFSDVILGTLVLM